MSGLRRAAAGVDGGADLRDELLGLDDLLAVEVAAAVREHLVLDLDAVSAGALEDADGVAHVHGVAEAGVRVDDQRQADGLPDRRHVLDEL